MSISQMQTTDSNQVATTSSSSNVQTRDELCQEQSNMMREWVMSKMPPKLLPYFKNVKNAWDRTEVITACIKDLNYNDIILCPMVSEYSSAMSYEPYFKLNTLGKMLGYAKPKDLFSLDKPLRLHKKYVLEDLKCIYKTPHNEASYTSIIPEHLDDKTDKNRNTYLYIDYKAYEDLISAAMKQSKFKEKALEFKNATDMIKCINDTFTATLNKEMSNYIAKLNQGTMPSTKERETMKVICANTSTCSTPYKSKEELTSEQESAMREWVLSRMPTKLMPYFKNVKNAWDRTEVITSCLRDLNYKDIILTPKINTFTEEITYVPYFKLNSLASTFGYVEPAKLFKDGRVLSSHAKYTINTLKDINICKGQNAPYAKSIIPEHLDNKSDPRNNDYIYIDLSACEDLISAAMKQSKFKDNAKEFKEVLMVSSEVTNAIITKLNQLVAEYRFQQQTQRIQAIEADKKHMEEKRKRLEEETKILALKKFPDIQPLKSHYGYVFSSPEYMATNLYKIGITDNLTNREQSAKTYCPTGSFLHTVETYDARSTERMVHQALKEHNLWHEISSGNEWFYIPSLDEAKELLNLATNNTSAVYDRVASFTSKLRDCYITNPISAPPQQLAIKDDPSIDAIIASYVNDVVQHLITNNITCMSKTNMILLLRKIASDPKYKKKKDRLPTELEAFLTDKNIRGITLTKKPTKSQMKIEIETM